MTAMMQNRQSRTDSTEIIRDSAPLQRSLRAVACLSAVVSDMVFQRRVSPGCYCRSARTGVAAGAGAGAGAATVPDGAAQSRAGRRRRGATHRHGHSSILTASRRRQTGDCTTDSWRHQSESSASGQRRPEELSYCSSSASGSEL